MRIRIASWNIAGGRPSRSNEIFDYAPEDIGYFASVLQNIDADVVCLQEAATNSVRSTAMELAGILGEQYRLVEFPQHPSHIDASDSLGTAILSRRPFQEHQKGHLPYPTFPLVLPNGEEAKRHEKGWESIRIDNLTVATLQLQPLRYLGTPYDSNNGRAYAADIETKIISVLYAPLILCGDFNFDDIRMLYPNLFGKLSLSEALPNIPTRPGGKRSDHILFTQEFEVVDSGVIETNSDHFLCWADLMNG